MFISFEGIEGCGKSTQIERLKKYLSEKLIICQSWREPGGTIFGEQLRQAILTSQTTINPLAEAMLFASARAQLLSEAILPFIKQKNHWALVDRYFDSSLAYQGVARKLGVDLIEKLHSDYPLNIMPDITFYLKISLECSMQRQAKRAQAKDYFEQEKNEFYRDLIEGYDQAAKRYPNRIIVIDAQKEVDDVFGQIISHLVLKSTK
jgi:dTMP kinase